MVWPVMWSLRSIVPYGSHTQVVRTLLRRSIEAPIEHLVVYRFHNSMTPVWPFSCQRGTSRQPGKGGVEFSVPKCRFGRIDPAAVYKSWREPFRPTIRMNLGKRRYTPGSGRRQRWYPPDE